MQKQVLIEQDKRTQAKILYKGESVLLEYHLLDDGVVQLSLTSKNSVSVRTFSQSYQEIVKEYPFLTLIYDTASAFINLIQYSANNNRLQLVEDRILEMGVTFGHQEKKVSFVFNYEKPSETQVTDLMQSLVNRICALEKDNQEMKKEIERGLSEFGRRLKFKFINPDKNQIELSDDDRTIKKIGQNCLWTGVIGDRPVFSKGKSFFEIQIKTCTASCYFMIGYVQSKESYSGGYYNKPTGHAIYCASGYHYCAQGQKQSLSGKKLEQNNILKIVFDSDKFTLTFYINGKKQGSEVQIPEDKKQINKIYPFVDMYNTNDIVTLLV